MQVTRKDNGYIYILSNEKLCVGDEVYPISRGLCTDSAHIHTNFLWKLAISGWRTKPHTIIDLHYSDYKPYEIRTSHGYGPKEMYFKIIFREKV